MKQKFLVAYDYGMGGAWYVMLANSREEILSKFSELHVFEYEHPPEWMSGNVFKSVTKGEFYDVDKPPKELLTLQIKK